VILKASQRAGAKQLAAHLLRTDENDHVEVHQIRGFASSDLQGALREAYAISQGTKCRQFLFSVSLSPPEIANVSVKVFEQAIDALENRVGLTGQPRVIVFHEKNGRRHAHCVWSRIKADEVKAINLPHFKRKLTDLSRDLYLEHGWKMPEGLVRSEARNPLNFSREEWQQAQRVKRDPRVIKEALQDCWATSDSLPAFRNALESRGYYLAQGDRRGYVAVGYQGEIYSLSRWCGVKSKELKERLGDPEKLPSVEEVKAKIEAKLRDKLAHFTHEARAEFASAQAGLLEQKRKLVALQRHERQILRELQLVRWMQDQRERLERFRGGLKGLWDRLTGRHASIAERNAKEVLQAGERDDRERQALIIRQLEDRRALQRQIRALAIRHEQELSALKQHQTEPARTFKPTIAHLRRKRQQGPSFSP
jgi:hypothetical protein